MMPTEYQKYLAANLNAFERMTAAFSGLDERLDYANMLLTKILVALGAAPPPPSGEPSTVSYILENKVGFTHGQTTVTTAGTAVQLVTSDIFVSDGFEVTVVAKPDNSGTIYIGKSKSDAEGGMCINGLSAGLALSLKIKNANQIWVNTDNAGDGVSWFVESDYQ